MNTHINTRSILKVDPVSRRANENRKKENQLPVEMLPLSNRRCGVVGHKWMYSATGMKVCTNYLCEVKRPYTPNEHAIKGRFT